MTWGVSSPCPPEPRSAILVSPPRGPPTLPMKSDDGMRCGDRCGERFIPPPLYAYVCMYVLYICICICVCMCIYEYVYTFVYTLCVYQMYVCSIYIYVYITHTHTHTHTRITYTTYTYIIYRRWDVHKYRQRPTLLHILLNSYIYILLNSSQVSPKTNPLIYIAQLLHIYITQLLHT